MRYVSSRARTLLSLNMGQECVFADSETLGELDTVEAAISAPQIRSESTADQKWRGTREWQ